MKRVGLRIRKDLEAGEGLGRMRPRNLLRGTPFAATKASKEGGISNRPMAALRRGGPAASSLSLSALLRPRAAVGRRGLAEPGGAVRHRPLPTFALRPDRPEREKQRPAPSGASGSRPESALRHATHVCRKSAAGSPILALTYRIRRYGGRGRHAARTAFVQLTVRSAYFVASWIATMEKLSPVASTLGKAARRSCSARASLVGKFSIVPAR